MVCMMKHFPTLFCSSLFDAKYIYNTSYSLFVLFFTFSVLHAEWMTLSGFDCS